MNLVRPLIKKANDHFDYAANGIVDVLFTADKEERLEAVDDLIWELTKCLENLTAAKKELQK